MGGWRLVLTDIRLNSDDAVFGPVPSRRLGMSLGVDLLWPKTCTLDCRYCELGRTTNLTTQRGPFSGRLPGAERSRGQNRGAGL